VFIFRTELRNMGSAVILFFSPKISVGDFVKIKDAKGKVLGIGFNVGIKNTEDNYMAYIPSSVVLRSKIINYTLGNGKNYYGDNEE
jgi:small-conductance mechanosensitive channel